MNVHRTAHATATLLALLATAALTACSAYPRTEADFGNSVRHMVASQAVVTGPVDRSPVETGDGERIDNVLGVYRSSVAGSEEVAAPLVLDLGSAR